VLFAVLVGDLLCAWDPKIESKLTAEMRIECFNMGAILKTLGGQGKGICCQIHDASLEASLTFFLMSGVIFSTSFDVAAITVRCFLYDLFCLVDLMNEHKGL